MGVKLNGWLKAVHVVTMIAIIAKQQLDEGKGAKEDKGEIKRKDASSTWSYTIVVVAKQQLKKRLKGWSKSVQVVAMIAIVAKQPLEGEELNFWHDVKGAVESEIDKVSKDIWWMFSIIISNIISLIIFYEATSMTVDSNQA